ncbi:MAG: hypothetical protein HY906_26020, partial [Deltaproteobacteria bacterium]|nr:hypothetical protein [Deltaproteobacteria bacterium]
GMGAVREFIDGVRAVRLLARAGAASERGDHEAALAAYRRVAALRGAGLEVRAMGLAGAGYEAAVLRRYGEAADRCREALDAVATVAAPQVFRREWAVGLRELEQHCRAAVRDPAGLVGRALPWRPGPVGKA